MTMTLAGNAMASTLLTVAIVTWNRPRFLGELLESLLEQNYDERYQLVVLDNGSAEPVEDVQQSRLRSFRSKPVVLRNPKNIRSTVVWQRVLDFASGEYVLVPGDDDLLAPAYLKTMAELASSGSSVTMVSAANRQIDANGRLLGTASWPAVFSSRVEALGTLLSTNPYSMPSSGFRRDAVDLMGVTPTTFAFDWWLWIQCWLHGEASVTDEVLVYYRQHAGQEKARIGREIPQLDGARMLIALLQDNAFRAFLNSLDTEQVGQLAEIVLKGPGPNHGESRWGPLIQMGIMDTLRPRLTSARIASLFAQAAGQAGIPPNPPSVGTVLGAPTPEDVSPFWWARLALGADWNGGCEHLGNWRRFLNLPQPKGATTRLAFTCSCSDGGRPQVSVAITRRSVTARATMPELVGEAGGETIFVLLKQVGLFANLWELAPSTSPIAARLFREVRDSRLGRFTEFSLRRLRKWYGRRT